MKTKKKKVRITIDRLILVILLVILILVGGYSLYKYQQEVFNERTLEEKRMEEKRLEEKRKLEEKLLEEKLLTLVNFEHQFPSTYDLKIIEYQNQKFDQVLFSDYKKMELAANKEGVEFKINTSYRSIETQESIYYSEVEKLIKNGYSEKRAIAKVEETVNKPGYSEHHTGLALDFGGMDYDKNQRMWSWLEKNSHLYGFILRYPKGKESITNISYEPWHYRYVGIKHAKNIFESNLVLEEYLLQNRL